ncbi:2-succinyl-5-enolpyruvyl-6-hydroxy-3-cyclohexene-1-carboxylic-acid synthase [Xylanimonas protaetiae]|uniref:2-succinyl-5-enolpyruvyl-6-hydroxy-3-cyclohexene-1-carboxylate synthase n=1 Tax=Xylanimonas protaetiae TaxID=2509457 RepID=A0A4P6F3P0_9MICO|nr:2-succinyl-5-enolpyruvyl-6-hydroxy-3-cyclohexene-1-carboxylic-acid synthase [Xylanimonas protaetiae]QAY69926.1 2-succinyl-5-enolpyruvyl-6-hydroxy-3-cyclohexene-1-carboxylic-acid synthase [Xylanimonas protaetiae]
MSGTEAPAVTAARALVLELGLQGVRDVVLAPGSRSAPLAYALAEAADAGTVRLHVRIDERAAGFLALGLARGGALREDRGPSADEASSPAGAPVVGPRPVAVVTTSGTAVANLHPAVLEAHHTGVPLVLLTADRPHELRGTGASQTTDQVGLFGTAVRYAADVPAPDGRDGEVRDLLATTGRALAAALGLRDRNPGPVHLNLAYRDPLHPLHPLHPTIPAVAAPWPAGTRRTVAPPAPGPGADPALYGDPARTLVVAGDGAGPAARALAEAQGWPLLAEPSSGACGGPNAVRAYRSVLGVDELSREVEHVVVLGRPTLSRPVQRLLGRPDVAVTVVAPGGAPWTDAPRNAERVVDALHARWFEPGASADRGFLDRWLAASRAAAVVVDEETSTRDIPLGAAPFAALAVARAVAAATGPDDVLVVGSSNPVRDLDLVLGLDGEPGTVLAHRGLAGIDGTVSAAYGVALAGGRRTRALLGDLTFLHDVGGLLHGPLEPAADLQVVVVNDDGGSIFATLEHGELAAASDAGGRTFERVFGTPHGVDLGPLCAGYGAGYRLVTDLAGLRAALAAPGPGVDVVEVRVPRAGRLAESRALHQEIVAAARAAVAPVQDAPSR